MSLTSSSPGRVLSSLFHTWCRQRLLRQFHVSPAPALYRGVPPERGKEYVDHLRRPPDSPANSKLVYVTVLGMPNAGKSTLINQLVGRKLFGVSRKVHTTRNNARAIVNIGETQVVFLDTPGVVGPTEAKRHRLEKSFLDDPSVSRNLSDVVVVLHDAGNRWTRHRLAPQVLRLLQDVDDDKDLVLVLNKVDLVKKKEVLLEISRVLTKARIGGEPMEEETEETEEEKVEGEQGSPFEVDEEESLVEKYAHVITDQELKGSRKRRDPEREVVEGFERFSRIFMISALSGDGVQDLKEYILSRAVPSPWRFHSSVVMDQDPGVLVRSLVREKFLEKFKAEIPYTIKFSIKTWRERADLLYIEVAVMPQKKVHAKYLIGPKGSFIKEIANATEKELMNLFQMDVKLVLRVATGGEADADLQLVAV